MSTDVTQRRNGRLGEGDYRGDEGPGRARGCADGARVGRSIGDAPDVNRHAGAGGGSRHMRCGESQSATGTAGGWITEPNAGRCNTGRTKLSRTKAIRRAIRGTRRSGKAESRMWEWALKKGNRHGLRAAGAIWIRERPRPGIQVTKFQICGSCSDAAVIRTRGTVKIGSINVCTFVCILIGEFSPCL
ncbi:unnamed protein product [Mycena citricolor]|uniref:Uncharacterized protein n=1 Tax=Mycena citricolor TaxID=2018698 RepID=A0AAD2H3P5_9AGAR|nr:unnamed protein product [Mycena citricolor]